jgi:hypothetical protein
MVHSGLLFVVALWLPPRWRPSPCLGGGEVMPRGNSRPGSSRATMAASGHRFLLQGIIMASPCPLSCSRWKPKIFGSGGGGTPVSCSSWGLCLGAHSSRLSNGCVAEVTLRLAIFGKACFMPSPCWATLVLLFGLWVAWVGSRWWSASGGVSATEGRACLLARSWVSSGPTLLLSSSAPSHRSLSNGRPYCSRFRL